jgi:hypothetical protein
VPVGLSREEGRIRPGGLRALRCEGGEPDGATVDVVRKRSDVPSQAENPRAVGPPSRSRVHRARHLLGELHRLLTKLERAYGLAKEPDEQKWVRQTADAIERQIFIGDTVLGGFADPRPEWKARKRQPDLF